jgi:hypothetical protein
MSLPFVHCRKSLHTLEIYQRQLPGGVFLVPRALLVAVAGQNCGWSNIWGAQPLQLNAGIPFAQCRRILHL